MVYQGYINARSEITRPPNILVVEYDERSRDDLVGFFRSHSYEVHAARNGAEMQTIMAAEPIDLVVLEVALPGEDGLAICSRVASESDVAIIIASARGEQIDRIVGLELGADDYLAKPFAPRELLARARAVLRRRSKLAETTIDRTPLATGGLAFAGFRFDPTRRHLKAANGVSVALTGAESALLKVLAESAGKLISRNELIDRARGVDADVYDRSVDVLVSRVRRKLQACGAGELIKTIRGRGYLFDVRVSRM